MPGSASDYLKDIIESLSSSKESAQIIEQIKKLIRNYKFLRFGVTVPGIIRRHYTIQAKQLTLLVPC